MTKRIRKAIPDTLKSVFLKQTSKFWLVLCLWRHQVEAQPSSVSDFWEYVDVLLCIVIRARNGFVTLVKLNLESSSDVQTYIWAQNEYDIKSERTAHIMILHTLQKMELQICLSMRNMTPLLLCAVITATAKLSHRTKIFVVLLKFSKEKMFWIVFCVENLVAVMVRERL